jgi:undecaprenyl-diphosphatase
MTRVIHWIGRNVRGFHAAVGILLTIGLGLVAGTVVFFVVVATLAARGATERFDHGILFWFHARSSPRLDLLALEITALGSASVTGVIVIVASIFLWSTRHRYSAALLWVALGGGWALANLLKFLIDRPRPDLFEWRVPHAGASSYPSGHSTTAMALYATLTYLLVRLESTAAMRRLTVAVLGVVVLLVGLSRVYLGVHYPSDVLGGYLIGFAWATVAVLGMEAIRYFRQRRQHSRTEEGPLHGDPPAGRPILPAPGANTEGIPQAAGERRGDDG